MNVIKFIQFIIVKIIGFFIWFVNSPAWIVFLCLVTLYVLYKIYLGIRTIMLKNIVYTREFSENGVYAGEFVVLTETIRNEGFFPLLGVDIEAYFFSELKLVGYENFQQGAMQHFVSRFNLMPYVQISRRHSIKCETRGYFQLKTATIPGTILSLYFDSPAQIYVYPKPFKLNIYDLATGWIQGELLSRRRIYKEPFSFSGIRDYRFGDSMSQINFKASARFPLGISGSTSLKVNERDFCSARRVMVLLDGLWPIRINLNTQEYEAAIELGLSYASAIVSSGIYNGYSVGFSTNSRCADGTFFSRLDCESGESHLLEILKSMASIHFREGTSFSSLVEKEIKEGFNYTEYVVFCFDIDDKVATHLQLLEHLGNSVAIVKLGEGDELT